MNKKNDEYFKKLIAELAQINHINPKDIPEIELYMDQVTSFMDSKLNATKRHDEDKILTKTMINNYAKNKLLPPPVNKKYSKQHLLILIYIYYLKNMLSISDITDFLTPVNEKYFNAKSGIDVEDIYKTVYKNEKQALDGIIEDLYATYERSRETFLDAPEEDQEFLQFFSFISSLAFDVYVKKHLIEKILDESNLKGYSELANEKAKAKKNKR